MSFVTFEQKINAQRAAEKKVRKERENRERRTTFTKHYPNVSFNDLTPQHDYISTDDSSIHYLHVNTNIVYSFEYEDKYWYHEVYPQDHGGLFN